MMQALEMTFSCSAGMEQAGPKFAEEDEYLVVAQAVTLICSLLIVDKLSGAYKS